jgi:pentapeptide MXKDX repeat protein
MTTRSRIARAMSVAVIALGLLPPAAFGDEMKKDTMSKESTAKDTMKKDTMSKDGMKKEGTMPKDHMKKDDGMMKKN